MIYEHNEQFLAHYGIKGQKHGVRRFQNEDGSLTEEGKKRYGVYDRPDGTKDMKRLQKDAANDAKEYARAKAYYGEGAGTRRKKIKNQISERMKDPDYKKAFDEQMKNQDMSKHQQAANRERKVEDTKKKVGQTARGIKNILLGVGTTSVAALGLVNLAKATGMDKKIAAWGKQAFSKVTSAFQGRSSNSSWNSNGHYSNATFDFLNRQR